MTIYNQRKCWKSSGDHTNGISRHWTSCTAIHMTIIYDTLLMPRKWACAQKLTRLFCWKDTLDSALINVNHWQLLQYVLGWQQIRGPGPYLFPCSDQRHLLIFPAQFQHAFVRAVPCCPTGDSTWNTWQQSSDVTYGARVPVQIIIF